MSVEHLGVLLSARLSRTHRRVDDLLVREYRDGPGRRICFFITAAKRNWILSRLANQENGDGDKLWGGRL